MGYAVKRMLPAPTWSHYVNGSAEIKSRVIHTNAQRFNEPDADADPCKNVFKFQIHPTQGGLGKKFKGMVGVGTMPDVIQPRIGIGFGVLYDLLLLYAVCPVGRMVDKI